MLPLPESRPTDDGGPYPPGCAHRGGDDPALLVYAVRHGQSTINAGIRPATLAEGDDMVIELTDLGRRQAVALGRRLAGLPEQHLPDLVLCSPYRRAVSTWALAREQLDAAGRPAPCVAIDPYLHDRYRGTLSRIPGSEVRQRFPDEYAAERADPLGYRPPGGESFHDVADRLSVVVDRITRDRRHHAVLVVAHDAVVLLLRRLLERLDDSATLAIAADGLAGNASVTAWQRTASGHDLVCYDDRTHLPDA